VRDEVRPPRSLPRPRRRRRRRRRVECCYAVYRTALTSQAAATQKRAAHEEAHARRKPAHCEPTAWRAALE
jgi:hypothetical protein